MNNPALLRSLIIFGLCVPLSIFVGYQLTDPMASSTFLVAGVLVLVLASPLLLRWHHFFLVASWNLIAVLFFLPGQPYLWLFMAMMSLGISVLQRSTSKDMRFINVSQLTWPLVFFAVVVLVTAQMTGGIGIRALGSGVYGGKRYIYLLGAILGYFALTLHRIPKEKAGLFVGVFFLTGVTALIGDLFSFFGPSMYFIFYVFPPNLLGWQQGFFEVGTSRLIGAGSAGCAAFFCVVALYGIRGILDIKRPWRLVVTACSIVLVLLCGYRGALITLVVTVAVQFFLEGLHKSKLLPALLLGGLLFFVVAIPVASKLPYMVQRSLTVVPFLKVDPLVKADADTTVEWRFKMWQAVLPQVTEYFWLGKGFGLSASDFDAANPYRESQKFAEESSLALAGDFHNGPLSVLIPLGIWGAIAFVWLIIAGTRVLYSNYKHGPPELRTYNMFLLAAFIGRTLIFVILGGGIQTDLAIFTGLLGLSVSLNGGVCRRSQVTVTEAKGEKLASFFSRGRPAFQR